MYRKALPIILAISLLVAGTACQATPTFTEPTETPPGPINTALPEQSATPTAVPTQTTAPTTATETPTPSPPTATPTSIPPTATSLPPSATPLPPALQIQFAPGGTSSTIESTLAAGQVIRYVFGAMAGQLVEVDVMGQFPLQMMLVGADGTVLQSGNDQSVSFRGYVATTQNYYIQIATTTATNYVLTLIIPARISFEAGATSATVTGTLMPLVNQYYLAHIEAGQLLEVDLFPPNAPMQLVIYGVDGTVLLSMMAGAPSFRGTVPTTEDYFIEISANTTVSFTMDVTIPERITFAPGATSATVQGQLPASGRHSYVLKVLAGQFMQVSMTAPAGTIRMPVYGVDGSVLSSGNAEVPGFQGLVPITEDYLIDVFSNAAVQYTLTVIIPERITFQSGATSITLQGSIAGGTTHYYILGASAGQAMSVTVTSPANNVIPAVYGVDGSVLKLGTDGLTTWQGTLPTTQDYWVDLVSMGQTATYTLSVSITG
jgi:hypothetical protein